jgi:hypothetical protein
MRLGRLRHDAGSLRVFRHSDAVCELLHNYAFACNRITGIALGWVGSVPLPVLLVTVHLIACQAMRREPASAELEMLTPAIAEPVRKIKCTVTLSP